MPRGSKVARAGGRGGRVGRVGRVGGRGGSTAPRAGGTAKRSVSRGSLALPKPANRRGTTASRVRAGTASSRAGTASGGRAGTAVSRAGGDGESEEGAAVGEEKPTLGKIDLLPALLRKLAQLEVRWLLLHAGPRAGLRNGAHGCVGSTAV